jgi:uncharacterized C2H2 Zn-finger protein
VPVDPRSIARGDVAAKPCGLCEPVDYRDFDVCQECGKLYRQRAYLIRHRAKEHEEFFKEEESPVVKRQRELKQKSQGDV